ncbi:MAG: methyltransferase domain-containing protein [Candidatus Omnitrophica bacterium]|nr:methyltransferase domain-containing protein [Candidatus Omnitrophota bacterium]
MRADWDYTSLAAAYLKRPDYAWEPIRKMLDAAGLKEGAEVCDIGAGAGHLTRPLAGNKFHIVAVEPNEAMRKNGIAQTASFSNVTWHEGTAENTGQPASFFNLVVFGSSFNVTNRAEALRETARILKPGGWFACLWNHRDLTDPLQAAIENEIKTLIRGYDYGSRREDQAPVIQSSGLFDEVRYLEGKTWHEQKVSDCLEAWRSHATLSRQAGERIGAVLSEIERVILSAGKDPLLIPYVTRIWFARLGGR